MPAPDIELSAANNSALPLQHVEGACTHQSSLLARCVEAVAKVAEKIAPVWPLANYVAVNPYMGFAGSSLLATRHTLRSLSNLETLMPVDYYREPFKAGKLRREHIDASLDELVAEGVEGAERIDVNQIVALVRATSEPRTSCCEEESVATFGRLLYTVSEMVDQQCSSDWSRVVLEEVSKHCASHYDQGQALWRDPLRRRGLYDAWRLSMKYDHSFEILGIRGLNELAAGLPADPNVAIDALLSRLQIPEGMWTEFLLCTALAMPGWSAWANYQTEQASRRGEECSDFAGLLAIRLACEVAVAEELDFSRDWLSLERQLSERLSRPKHSNDVLVRYALLKASEIAFRNQLLSDLPGDAAVQYLRKLAQVVFCIDVRSERLRRHLEAASTDVDTFGFAGFFGIPLELVQLGEKTGAPHVPALISPKFKVYEGFEGNATKTKLTADRRSQARSLRRIWREFQTSAVSCFAFVETTGLLYGLKLLSRSLGKADSKSSRYDGVAPADQPQLGPTLKGLSQQHVSLAHLADLAESALRGIGIVSDFARLVVFCAHGSETENNPLQAGLDCGACGGHSGEPNARLAAKLLNAEHIRLALAGRGIEIPQDTHFVAALHNTTTDVVQLFDVDGVPATHHDDLEQLRSLLQSASQQTRMERLPLLGGHTPDDLLRRSCDWSEVRPEWGLAGNAAFIAAPRDLTRTISLDGRSFLHSYDHRKDPGFKVLEQIMTAPLVVANWINMQYYASTVDPDHFGSGNKTLHNIVGQFGVFSGNGGDLLTGLPWQSVHDGHQYRHQPLRLLAVIAAPREAIEAIIDKHQVVADLVHHGWVQLVAIEECQSFHYIARRNWNEVSTSGEQRRCDPLAV